MELGKKAFSQAVKNLKRWAINLVITAYSKGVYPYEEAANKFKKKYEALKEWRDKVVKPAYEEVKREWEVNRERLRELDEGKNKMEYPYDKT